jgi:hypothetical protein
VPGRALSKAEPVEEVQTELGQRSLAELRGLRLELVQLLPPLVSPPPRALQVLSLEAAEQAHRPKLVPEQLSDPPNPAPRALALALAVQVLAQERAEKLEAEQLVAAEQRQGQELVLEGV